NTTLLYDESAAGNGAIDPSGSRGRQFKISLPDGSRGVGDIKFVVVTDTYNQVFELNSAGTGGSSTAEINNSANLTRNSTLAPYPDLTVDSLALSPTPGLLSGNPLLVHWSDKNTGNKSVSTAFSDHIVIVNTTTNKTLSTQDLAFDPAAQGSSPI